MKDILARQLAICQRFGLSAAIPSDDQKVGLSAGARNGGHWPLNGLRHPGVGDTSGWYIWSGTELGTDANLFTPVHVTHLAELCPAALPYLALPPGWRFLIAPNHEDIWRDDSLLRI